MKTPASEAIKKMNDFAEKGIPFFFIIDFDADFPEVIPLDEIDSSGIRYDFAELNEGNKNKEFPRDFTFNLDPVSYTVYAEAFDYVMRNLRYGNSYLVNLTFPTPVETNLSLEDIFYFSRAKYKILFRDKFVVFSPETFVTIKDGKIYSHPMKGTIDASIPDAEKIILSSYKETAEHNTIVDLIRNDLSMVSENVRVEKFRYIDKLETSSGELLQVSSRIAGELSPDYEKNPGEIIFKMLPAGSVTGAPKSKTVEIIKSAEGYQRGFYTGIAGIYKDGNLNSCVLIRFIEKTESGLVYKSGGGITIHSHPEEEYRELIKKVYVPFI